MRLPDGTPLAVRSLTLTDRTWLAASFADLSERSRYRRFLVPVRSLSERMLEELVDAVDQDRHVAVVAVVGMGEGSARVGVARYIRLRNDPQIAEVAVTVGDIWQGRGVGRALMSELVGRARGAGVGAFCATVSADNAPSLALLRAAGVARRWHVHNGVVDAEVTLAPVSSPA